MVKMGHRRVESIRPVKFAPVPGGSSEVELSSLDRMRLRGGAREFLDPQRLDFDLLIRIEQGGTVHTVDFTEYRLGPGDVLWVRAGQVQQWGRITEIDGTVVLFTAPSIEEGARALLRTTDWRMRNHWPAAQLVDAPASLAFDLLIRCLAAPTGPRRAPIRHALAALLLLLAEEPTDTVTDPPANEPFRWLRDEIDAQFATMHKVSEYAARLGYSTRTVNRLAREHTGLSAKQLIDERVILEAKRLLTHAPDSVARISERLGFDDPSNFSKYFHQRTGATPAAFRVRVASSNQPR